MEKMLLIDWKLCTEWYCVSKEATEEEILNFVRGLINVVATDNQIKQRLFGGFPCGDYEDRYHIFHDTGHYTYTGVNGDVDEDYRENKWKTLLEANKEPLVMDALFMEDIEGAIDVPVGEGKGD